MRSIAVDHRLSYARGSRVKWQVISWLRNISNREAWEINENSRLGKNLSVKLNMSCKMYDGTETTSSQNVKQAFQLCEFC